MKSALLFVIIFSSINLMAETRYSTQDYIEQWKVTAINQMNAHQIPASITLAQGILESGNGNSRLAKQAKNHFGIKCHTTWNGDTFFQDDDKKNECFRSYQSASESYRDHSLFLSGRKRYAGLFTLKLSDYKGWAKGLKSAGYATNPKYAHLLIELIEKYDLAKYDKMPNLPQQLEEEENLTTTKPEHDKPVKVEKPIQNQTTETEIVYEVELTKHTKNLNHNKVAYIVVQKGDTFFRIAQELKMPINQLYKYNEFNKKDVLKIGDIIYVSPKKGRGHRDNPIYVCEKDMSLREVAHIEGIKLKKLLKFNLMDNPDKKLPKGTKVILR